MIGALTGDEALLRASSARIPVLQRHFERSLDRLRAASGVNDLPELLSDEPQQQRREVLERLAREKIAVTAGDLLELRGDRGIHLAIAVTDAEGSGAARAIEIPAALAVVEPAALTVGDARQRSHPPAGATMATRAAQPHSARGGICMRPLRYSMAGVRSRECSSGPSRSTNSARCATTMPGAMASEVPAMQPTMIPKPATRAAELRASASVSPPVLSSLM